MRIPSFLTATFFALALLGGVFPGAARAATFTVTSTLDTGDGVCDADCTLREAIDAAGQVDNTDFIRFASPLFDRFQNIQLTGKPLSVYSSRLIIDGPDNAILMVNGTNQSSVFTLFNSVVDIDDLVMTHGNSTEFISRGGCIVSSETNLTLKRCVISNSEATQGGAIFNSKGILTMTNCTLTRNAAVKKYRAPGLAQGGAIYNDRAGVVSLFFCTITDNEAIDPAGSSADPGSGLSGGVFNNSLSNAKFSINDCIIAGNTHSATVSNPTGGPDLGGTILSRGYNLIGDLGGSNNFRQQPTDIVNTDPLFELDPSNGNRPFLKDNGGATLTVALLPNSPAVNAGILYDSEDQRNASRFVGSKPDIGAYELDRVPVITGLTLSPNPPFTNDPITATLAVSDPDSFYLAKSYIWQRTRRGWTETLPEKGAVLSTVGPVVEAGDTLTATAVVNDGFNEVRLRSESVTVQNSPIRLTRLILNPRSPYTRDALTVTVEASDPDRTRPLFTYIWLKNGVVTQRVAGTSSSKDSYDLKADGQGDRDDVIRVVVVASDGSSGDTLVGTTVVLNSIPIIERVALTPISPTPQRIVTATFGGRDADQNDRLKPIYNWRINNKVVSGEKSARLDLSKFAKVKAGDVVTVEARLTDGTAFSRVFTASVTVVGGAVQTAPSGGAL